MKSDPMRWTSVNILDGPVTCAHCFSLRRNSATWDWIRRSSRHLGFRQHAWWARWREMTLQPLSDNEKAVDTLTTRAMGTMGSMYLGSD